MTSQESNQVTIRPLDLVRQGEYSASLLMSPEYRFSVAEEIARATDCWEILLFDDVVNAVDPAQRRALTGLAGYERAAVVSVPFSASMNVNVLMQAPPLPAEMALVSKLYATVPHGNEFHIWIPQGENFTDVYALYQEDPNQYEELVRQTFRNPPKDNPHFHLEAARLFLQRSNQAKTLIMPFQTNDLHHQVFMDLVTSGKAVLPDSTQRWISKSDAHQYFSERDLATLMPETRYINMDDAREKTDANLELLTKKVIDTSLDMVAAGKTPYIKIIATGVSGIGNIKPDDNPLLQPISEDDTSDSRISKFKSLVKEKLEDSEVIPDAVVEETIPIGIDAFGRREHVVSGIVVQGVWYPWSVTRTINNEHDVYQGMMIAADPATIGLTQAEYIQAVRDGEQFARAMANGGYQMGYVAKDFIKTPTNEDIFHDHNDRRGGRSADEVVGPLLSIDLHDKDYLFEVPEGEDSAEYILKVTQILLDNGYYIYGSCTAYFPSKHGNNRVYKLKVLSPLNEIKQQRQETETLTETAERVVGYVLRNYDKNQ